ncbi:MAG: hypothetical protein AAFN93_23750, partial [Bacteroidota bacterium]
YKAALLRRMAARWRSHEQWHLSAQIIRSYHPKSTHRKDSDYTLASNKFCQRWLNGYEHQHPYGRQGQLQRDP